MCNKKYVYAENEGTRPLVNNRNEVDSWERFAFVKLENGYTAIKALVNNKYLACYENKYLYSDSSIVDNESMKNKFQIVFSFYDQSIIGIKSLSNNKYVHATVEANKPLEASHDIFYDWEMFKIKTVNV